MCVCAFLSCTGHLDASLCARFLMFLLGYLWHAVMALYACGPGFLHLVGVAYQGDVSPGLLFGNVHISRAISRPRLTRAWRCISALRRVDGWTEHFVGATGAKPKGKAQQQSRSIQHETHGT